ncbi:uncharacterized protein [Amphiura filiformis]|uniref:uncharacterized protein n=1 Tax=Amphiura filiformis TaxID=82378 RepID=UPI003B21C00E
MLKLKLHIKYIKALKSKTMQLNFCQTCGYKQVRDVQHELSKLFANIATYKPDLCGICLGIAVNKEQKKQKRKTCEKIVVKEEIVSEDDDGKEQNVSGDETDEYKVESNSSQSDDDNDEDDAKQTMVIKYEGLKYDFKSITADLDPKVIDLVEESDNPKQCLKCKFCNKQFTYVNSLLRHITTHTGSNAVEKPFKCNLCEAAFDRRYNLKIHGRKHSEHRPFKCNFPPCTATFKDKHTLAGHEETHTGAEKRHKCEFCSKVFKKRYVLETHLRVHTGDKPYMCKFCGFCCTQKQNLVIHERQHTKEKPFRCKFCNKGFYQGVQLQQHEMDHTGAHPYVCEICGYTCKAKSYLKQHMSIHRSERPFKCSKCDYTSKRRENIRSHERVHTTEKPFKCSQCSKLFKHKDSLTKHERRHSSRDTDGYSRVQRQRKRKPNPGIKPPQLQLSNAPKDPPVIVGGGSPVERFPHQENRMLIPPAPLHQGYPASGYNSSMGILTHHIVTHPQVSSHSSAHEYEPVDVVFNML